VKSTISLHCYSADRPHHQNNNNNNNLEYLGSDGRIILKYNFFK
jgi:hypothetical protein